MYFFNYQNQVLRCRFECEKCKETEHDGETRGIRKGTRNFCACSSAYFTANLECTDSRTGILIGESDGQCDVGTEMESIPCFFVEVTEIPKEPAAEYESHLLLRIFLYYFFSGLNSTLRIVLESGSDCKEICHKVDCT